MRPKNKKWFVFFPLLLVAGVALFGGIVMYLWNAVMVPAVGAHIISFWQALGLLVLSRILVGGFGGRGRGHGNRRKAFWMMSPEEKEKFREEWKQRSGTGMTDVS